MKLLKSIIFPISQPCSNGNKSRHHINLKESKWRQIQRQLLVILEHDRHDANFSHLSELWSSLSTEAGVWSSAVGGVEGSKGLPRPRLGLSNRSAVSSSAGSHYRIHGPIHAGKCLVMRKSQLLSLSSCLLRLFIGLCLSSTIRL